MADYNGWSNYETWAVKLWLDNEEPVYRYWQDRTRAVKASPTYENEFMDPARIPVFQLSEELKTWHEDQLPELKGFAADLLGAAFGDVNWTEIAEALLEEAQ